INEFDLSEPTTENEAVPATPAITPLTPVERVLRKIQRRLLPSSIPQTPKNKHSIDQSRVEAMLNTLFGDATHGLVIFDWVTLAEFHRNFAEAIIQGAQRRGFGNVSLPHGDTPYFNKMFKLGDLNYESVEHFQDNPSDCVVVPNPLTAERYTPYRNDDQLKIAGSPRYNSEWMGILDKLMPPYIRPASEGKLKVLLFLRNPVFPIFWEEVITAIQMITQFPDVFLVVKHHTRGGSENTPHHREHLEMSKLNQMTAPNLEIEYNDVHSGSLIEWADVVMELGTSISNEAIVHNKPLLALEFLHSNISTVAHYLPGTALRCKDDLYDALVILRKDKTHHLYTAAERQHFIDEMIHYPDERVLERFVDLLREQLAKSQQVMSGL
ncbi:MAG TPA: hypothetical protein VHL11_06985, partial [Phototrophicaceae bacterium]|nr:hypothetical protein [Phototrophicaceae bacterium]